MTLSHLKSWEDLSIGSYGILEPRIGKIRKTNPKDIDLFIVPGVAFDKYGNRVRHGKGYYDRLLEKTKSTIVGLCFEFQLVEKIPIEPHDKPVDIILTENRIIKC